MSYTQKTFQTSGQSKELFRCEDTTRKKCLHVIAIIRTVEEMLSSAGKKAQRLQLNVISVMFTTAIVIVIYVMRLSGGSRSDDHLLLRVVIFLLTTSLAVQLWNATQMFYR